MSLGIDIDQSEAVHLMKPTYDWFKAFANVFDGFVFKIFSLPVRRYDLRPFHWLAEDN